MKVRISSNLWFISQKQIVPEYTCDGICYFIPNGTVGKALYRSYVNKVSSDIISAKLSTVTSQRYFMITTYPKLYVREIGDDVVSDCNKMMFNKNNLHSITGIDWDLVLEKLHEIKDKCKLPDNTNPKLLFSTMSNVVGTDGKIVKFVDGNCSYVGINDTTELVIANESTFIDKHTSDSVTLGTSCINAYLARRIEDIYVDWKKDNQLLKKMKKYIDEDDVTNKNTKKRIYTELKQKETQIKLLTILEKSESVKSMYDKLSSKLNLNTAGKKLRKIIITDDGAVKMFENSIDVAHGKIIDEVNEMNEDEEIDDKINGSDNMFKSFITLMTWLEELETQGCMGIALSTDIIKTGNQIDVAMREIPNNCLALLDFIDAILSDEAVSVDSGRINDMVITTEPYKKSVINVVLPLYINKIHWAVASKYLKITANLINYYYPFTKDRRFWKVYFNVLASYVTKLYGDISDHEIKIFMAYWKTSSEIRKIFKLKCNSIINSDAIKDHRYFDYVSLMGQIISDPSYKPNNLRTTIKYYVHSLCNRSKVEGHIISETTCGIRNHYLWEILGIMKTIYFYKNIHKDHSNLLSDMDELYSVITDSDASTIKNLILGFNSKYKDINNPTECL